jgi:hypothetical protein
MDCNGGKCCSSDGNNFANYRNKQHIIVDKCGEHNGKLHQRVRTYAISCLVDLPWQDGVGLSRSFRTPRRVVHVVRRNYSSEEFTCRHDNMACMFKVMKSVWAGSLSDDQAVKPANVSK